MLSRRAVVLSGCAALASCGFRPAYGPGGAAQKLRGAVVVQAPATVDGFTFSARLQDRFGPLEGTTPRYRLVVDLVQDRTAAAINADGDTTRINVLGQADWSLLDAAGTIVLAGAAQTFASYAATASTVATQTAAADAATRLAAALADLIVADITARAGNLP